MNQDAVQDSLVRQLEVIDKSIFWALAVASVIGWAGAHHTDPIEVIGLKSSRADAYFVAGWAFVLANIAILLAFLRMGDLLDLLDASNFKTGIEKVMTHSSFFNPFAFFGSGTLAQMYSGLGWGLLILCWWICLTSIGTLVDLSQMRRVLVTFLVILGILSTVAMHRCQARMSGKLQKVDAEFSRSVALSIRLRRVIATLAASGGLVMFTEVQWRLWWKPH